MSECGQDCFACHDKKKLITSNRFEHQQMSPFRQSENTQFPFAPTNTKLDTVPDEHQALRKHITRTAAHVLTQIGGHTSRVQRQRRNPIGSIQLVHVPRHQHVRQLRHEIVTESRPIVRQEILRRPLIFGRILLEPAREVIQSGHRVVGARGQHHHTRSVALQHGQQFVDQIKVSNVVDTKLALNAVLRRSKFRKSLFTVCVSRVVHLIIELLLDSYCKPAMEWLMEGS